MTQQQFNTKIFNDLTLTEASLINFNIYYNPSHIDYYQNYHNGNYDWCYDYLMKNRHILTIDSTPAQYRDVAEHMIRLTTK